VSARPGAVIPDRSLKAIQTITGKGDTTMLTSTTADDQRVVVGIDTHKNTHHAAVLDARGALLDDESFPATTAGYAQLLEWARRHGEIDTIGIEGADSYGAGLTRALQAAGIRVIAVPTSDKAARARRGKTDQLDAITAARHVLAGTGLGTPKDTTGTVEAIRILSTERDSLIKARTAAMNSLKQLLITAPAALRERLQPLTRARLLTAASRLRPDPARLGEPEQATKHALRAYATRIQRYDRDIRDADTTLTGLVASLTPRLLAAPGIGVHCAAQLLMTAAQNADRITSDAAFARLCGAAPIPVSSGNTHRMRLHRGGDRQANKALYLIIINRLRNDERTIAYRDRKLAQGHTTKDITRALKRYVARETYRLLKQDLNTT
jgi:transposase